MKIPLPNDTELEVYESQYTPEQIEDSIGKGVIIQNGTFWTWDVATSQYVDTGVHAGDPPDGSITAAKLASGAVTWPKLAPEVQLDHRNLLDNWYFVGGGSQQGGGQFPINQRGLTEYTGAVYTIDRWTLSNNVCKLLIESDGIRLSQNSTVNNSVFFIQRKQVADLPDGEYTFSAIVDNELLSITFDLSTSMGVVNSVGDKFRLRAQYINGVYAFAIYGYLILPTDSCKITAAKLELGHISTLAHESAGGWILNDPAPNFTDELMRCQRYFVAMDNVGNVSGQTWGANSYAASVSVPLPTPMRATPTVVDAELNYVICGDTFLSAPDLTFGAFTLSPGSAQVRIRLTLPDGETWPANNPISALMGKLVLSSEL